MNNQKILWVVFSITLFLLAVVVVGFIWFLPPDTNQAEEAIANAGVVAEPAPGSFDPIEWARGTKEVPGITEPATTESKSNDDLLLVVGAQEKQPSTGTQASTGVTVTETPAAGTSVRVATPEASRPAATPAPRTTTTTTQTTKPTPATSTPAPAPAPKPTTVRVTQYWIQAGSFASRSRAEQTQEALGDKGINARLTSVDVSGTTYFRVRIGPYDAKPEAEKFLDWIKEIDSFGSSYISEVYTTRTVN